MANADVVLTVPSKDNVLPYKTCEAFPPGSAFPPCDRPVRSNRLCDAHNQQRAAGKELGPIRKRRRKMPEYCTFLARDDDSAEPCGLPTVGDGLCNAHYQQRNRRGELVPVHTLRISQEVANQLRQEGRKFCPTCKQVKQLEDFPRSSAQVSGRAPYCAICSADYETAKRFSFVSIAALREFREVRNFQCDICKRRWQEGNQAFHIDHDKRCCQANGKSCGACVRGMLCGFCNTQGLAWYEAVGRFITPIPIFEDYLLRYESTRS